jgi:hypothetical protein
VRELVERLLDKAANKIGKVKELVVAPLEPVPVPAGGRKRPR